MGSVVSKKRKLKIKNVIPKDKDVPRASEKKYYLEKIQTLMFFASI